MKAHALVSEALGSAFLLAVIVGSGIMGERLSGGNLALPLLINSLATGAALVALIFAFSAASGAHFNPVVSLVLALDGELTWTDLLARILFQISGAIFGVLVAHFMFDLPLFAISQHNRARPALYISEFVATFGLIGVIYGTRRAAPKALPFAVGAYILAAYWFTSSTSFANPAVTLARSLSDTFAGIAPSAVAAFVLAQILGALSARWVWKWFQNASKELAT